MTISSNKDCKQTAVQKINTSLRVFGNYKDQSIRTRGTNDVVRYQGKIREDLGLEQGLLARQKPMIGDSSLLPGEDHWEALSTVQTMMMLREAKLSSRTCSLIGPHSSDIRITDRCGNTYHSGQGTSEEQIAAILSVPTGTVSATYNDVQTASAKTDNLVLRIAPTRSPPSTADNWRTIRTCRDTDSGVCLVELDAARQTSTLLNPGTQGLEGHQEISSSTSNIQPETQ